MRKGDQASSLEASLENLVVGQPEACNHLVSAYQTFLAGLSAPNRPIASFLFLGPTGTGKTRTVEALAETLVGSPKAMVKIDCAEFQHSQEIAKLIGSPPGYIGHRETVPLLSQENINQYRTSMGVPMSFLLFDEIEKANDALWNLLLGILDKGKLTLGDNRRVDFSKTMIFLTSNLGAKEMESLLAPKLGFRSSAAETEVDASKLKRSATEAARKRFTPEFMNRLDKVVVFRPLEEESLRRILDLELGFVQRRVLGIDGAESFVFTVSEAAKTRLIRLGTDARYGARNLKRVIEREVIDPLANLKSSGQAREGDWIQVELVEDDDGSEERLVFHRRSEGLGFQAMVEISGVNPLISNTQYMSSRAAHSDEYVMQAVGRSRR